MSGPDRITQRVRRALAALGGDRSLSADRVAREAMPLRQDGVGTFADYLRAAALELQRRDGPGR